MDVGQGGCSKLTHEQALITNVGAQFIAPNYAITHTHMVAMNCAPTL